MTMLPDQNSATNGRPAGTLDGCWRWLTTHCSRRALSATVAGLGRCLNAITLAGLFLTPCFRLQGGELLPSGQPADKNTVILKDEKMTFRKISPRQYGTNANDFFLLETEVTNEMYERYLKSTGRTKGDLELAASERDRKEKMRRSGRYTGSTSSPVYDVTNPALLWTNNTPPSGRRDFPVALITLADAAAFCQWLSSRYPEPGVFRLPSVDEWLIAAYGATRKYPWGDEWSFDIPCVSSSQEKRRTTTEPVKAHPQDKTPEGIYGLWGNVAEYVQDPKHFRYDTRWMGPSFKRYPTKDMFPFVPRNHWWGYVHNSASRQEDIGFRVLLEVRETQNDAATSIGKSNANHVPHRP